jgi:predicted DNA-binding transcriptional regulator AlpA
MDWPVSFNQLGVCMKKTVEAPHKRTQISDEFTASPELLKIIRDCQSVVDDTFLKVDEVSIKLAQGVSTTWRDVKNGTLPPYIQTNSRSVAWLASEINAVIAARVFASRSGADVNMQEFVAALIGSKPITPAIHLDGIKESK